MRALWSDRHNCSHDVSQKFDYFAVTSCKARNHGTPVIRVPPNVGLTPSAAWRPPPTPLRPRTPPPPPPPAWAAPSRSLAKRAKGGGGEEGRRGRGWKGLREGSSNYNGGWGDPPNTSWGQTHIWGLPSDFETLNLGARRSCCATACVSKNQKGLGQHDCRTKLPPPQKAFKSIRKTV